MTNETALYLKLLLSAGMEERYVERTKELFSSQEEYTDILAALRDCAEDAERGDTKPAFYTLSAYLQDRRVDTDAVLAMLVEDLRQGYESGRMTQSAVVSAMHYAAADTGKQAYEPWLSMFCMADYYCYALEGRFSKELFDEAFSAFLNDKTMISEIIGPERNKKTVFREMVAQEKKEMNRIRYVMNYKIVPAYLGLMLLLMVIGGVLMGADYARFETVGVVLFCVCALATLLLLASVPFVRNKEIRQELARYDFDVKPENTKDTYEFVADEMHIRFDAAGVVVDKEFFTYPNLSAELYTSGLMRRIQLSIAFYTKFGREFKIPLCPDALALLKRFQIRLKDEEQLIYLLKQKKQAFNDVYRYGILRPKRRR